MSILVMMIPITLLLVTLFVVFFVSAVFSDQFEDLETPKHQILMNDNFKLTKSNYQEQTVESIGVSGLGIGPNAHKSEKGAQS